MDAVEQQCLFCGGSHCWLNVTKKFIDSARSRCTVAANSQGLRYCSAASTHPESHQRVTWWCLAALHWQVQHVTLQLSVYRSAFKVLQPVQQLLAAHGYSMAALQPLMVQQKERLQQQLFVLKPQYAARLPQQEVAAIRQQLFQNMPLQDVHELLQLLAGAEHALKQQQEEEAAGGQQQLQQTAAVQRPQQRQQDAELQLCQQQKAAAAGGIIFSVDKGQASSMAAGGLQGLTERQELVPFTDFDPNLPGADMVLEGSDLGSLEEDYQAAGQQLGEDAEQACGIGWLLEEQAAQQDTVAASRQQQPAGLPGLVPFIDFDPTVPGAGMVLEQCDLGSFEEEEEEEERDSDWTAGPAGQQLGEGFGQGGGLDWLLEEQVAQQNAVAASRQQQPQQRRQQEPAGLPLLVPFTDVGPTLPGAGMLLQDGDLGGLEEEDSDWTEGQQLGEEAEQAGAIGWLLGEKAAQQIAVAASRQQEPKQQPTKLSELVPFTEFDPTLPGADMMLEGSDLGGLEGDDQAAGQQLGEGAEQAGGIGWLLEELTRIWQQQELQQEPAEVSQLVALFNDCEPALLGGGAGGEGGGIGTRPAASQPQAASYSAELSMPPDFWYKYVAALCDLAGDTVSQQAQQQLSVRHGSKDGPQLPLSGEGAAETTKAAPAADNGGLPVLPPSDALIGQRVREVAALGGGNNSHWQQLHSVQEPRGIEDGCHSSRSSLQQAVAALTAAGSIKSKTCRVPGHQQPSSNEAVLAEPQLPGFTAAAAASATAAAGPCSYLPAATGVTANTEMMLSDAAAECKRGHHCTALADCCWMSPLQDFADALQGTTLAEYLNGSLEAAAEFTRRWPQVFVLQQAAATGLGSGTGHFGNSAGNLVIGLKQGGLQWLLSQPRCTALLQEYRQALLEAVEAAKVVAAMAAAKAASSGPPVQLLQQQVVGVALSQAASASDQGGVMPPGLVPYKKVCTGSSYVFPAHGKDSVRLVYSLA